MSWAPARKERKKKVVSVYVLCLFLSPFGESKVAIASSAQFSSEEMNDKKF